MTHLNLLANNKTQQSLLLLTFTSFFKISQQDFIKPKLNPSGPGLFELSHPQITALTSSSEKSLTNETLSASEIELNLTLSSLT